jgi:hypothetical protein
MHLQWLDSDGRNRSMRPSTSVASTTRRETTLTIGGSTKGTIDGNLCGQAGGRRTVQRYLVHRPRIDRVLPQSAELDVLRHSLLLRPVKHRL